MRVAVAGASGFIGRRVVAALMSQDVEVTGLTHERPVGDAVRTIRGDLLDGSGLVDLVRSADALVHCASYVGSDDHLQQRVNVDGTARLLEAAQSAGIGRLIYLSTAGVYGGLGGVGATETLAPAPASPLSHSRLAAERLVLGFGGVVVRPNAVVGAGDRWYLTPLLRFMVHHSVWIENGAPRVSVIDAPLLGDVLASLALSPAALGVFHAAGPEPVTIRELVTPAFAELGIPTPERSVGRDVLRDIVASRGISESQLRMVAEDNVLDTTRLWEHLPGLARNVRLSQADLGWYAAAVGDAIPR